MKIRVKFFWSKGWFTLPERNFLILLHVDKFRLAIVQRSLFSSILSIKLIFHSFHPAHMANFFENRRKDQNLGIEWHNGEYIRMENYKKTIFFSSSGSYTFSHWEGLDDFWEPNQLYIMKLHSVITRITTKLQKNCD